MQGTEEGYQEEYSPMQFLGKRIRKITEAAYRVSDLFPLEEPLRWSLRTAALELFQDFSILEYVGEAERQRAVITAEEKIRRLLALIELASVGSYLSELNFAVLKREYSVFLNVIQEQQETLLPSQLQMLEKPQFGSGQTQIWGMPESVTARRKNEEGNEGDGDKNDGENRKGFSSGHTNGHSNGHRYIGLSDRSPKGPILDISEIARKGLISRNFNSPLSSLSQHLQPQEIAPKEKDIYEKTGVAGERKLPAPFGGGAVEEVRKRQILEMVKERGWVSVGDLASTFRGVVGEKTLQRDMLRMVDRGLLQKTGNKRWRRYALLDNT